MNRLVSIFFVLVIAIFLRAPGIYGGLPYFYNEDEAHHFNRLAEIAKSGDMNPHYFHKPSLHFYLRLPAFYLTYLAERSTGRMQSLDEIITRDRFGLAGFSFAASHPWFVVTSRLTSFAFTLATLLLLIPAGRFFRFSNSASTFSALAFAALPPFIAYAGTVGVDTLMTLLCFGASIAALRLNRSPGLGNLLLCAILAGAAVSSKYNALPIAALPLITLIISKERLPSRYFLALIIPPVAFLLCSPFIVFEFRTFWEQLSYEVWHYRVAGHVGNEAEPGIPQALFYLRWFWDHGTGGILLVLAAFGSLNLLRSRAGLIFLAFPVLYFIEMSLQKANFTRNMLVLLPYLVVCSGSAVQFAKRRVNRTAFQLSAFILCTLIVRELAPQIILERYNLSRKDARVEATTYINTLPSKETAIAGELQMTPLLFNASHNHKVRLSGSSLQRVYLAGFDRVVIGDEFPVPESVRTTKFMGSSESSDNRVEVDPTVRVIELDEIESSIKLSALKDTSAMVTIAKDLSTDCEGFTIESRCWLRSRLTKIYLPQNTSVELTVLSPWANLLEVLDSSEGRVISSQRIEAGIESKIILPFSRDGVIIFAKHLVTPKKIGLNSDERRLAIAITGISKAKPVKTGK